ncbi:STAS domain-containing protein [Streptomyces sp. NPDC015130]|uniref:STAS domain-containing protein n=1 Tax=Streptomyces sp. NPDC015130 TaxID=3364940 RepID=UPI0036F95AEF
MTSDRVDHLSFEQVEHTLLAGEHLYRSPEARVYRQHTRTDGTALLQAAGEFDLDSVGCLRQAVADARYEGASLVVLDVSEVAFGDSSFLHALVAAIRAPGRLVLRGPVPDQLRQLFSLTGTTQLFQEDEESEL